jgi:hypothetical protein
MSGAQIYRGEAYVMIRARTEGASPAELGFGTQSLTVFVEDVDGHYAHERWRTAEGSGGAERIRQA